MEYNVEVVDLLIRIGVPKKTARTLVYLSKGQESASLNIQEATRLRQPEVSLALRDLEQRGWVSKRNIKRSGKGRPIQLYKMTVPLDNAVSVLVESKKSEIEKINDSIKQLQQQVG
jgi:predicted transcriptional regulator